MRITLEHPVIVSGLFHYGGLRHDLVRTVGEFEVEEYGSCDAPVTFVLGDKPQQCYRTINGRHYSVFTDSQPGDDIVETARRLLYRNEEDGIAPISAATTKEAARIRRTYELTSNVLNQNQRYLVREERAGLSQASVDCMKAPKLKNWNWLSDATAFEVEYWHGQAAAVLSNLVLIDGIPFRRRAEPCLRLSLTSAPSVVTTPVYTSQVHRADLDLDGLHVMYPDALDQGTLYFGLGEVDEMYAFARDIGWEHSGAVDIREILDFDALFVDHLKMETIRHAHMVLERAQTMYARNLHIQKADGKSPTSSFGLSTFSLGETLAPLRDAIRSWQSDEGDPSAVAAAMDGTFSAMQALPNGPRIGGRESYTIVDQMNAFRARQDAAPITSPNPINFIQQNR